VTERSEKGRKMREKDRERERVREREREKSVRNKLTANIMIKREKR